MKKILIGLVMLVMSVLGAFAQNNTDADSKQGLEDTKFLLQSESHILDFSKRTSSEIQHFVTYSSMYIGIFASGPIDDKSYRIAKNLLNHVNMAVEILFEKKVMIKTQDDLNMFKLSMMQADTNLRDARDRYYRNR